MLTPNQQIEFWTLGTKLGQGSSGEVWRATDLEDNQVAIKLFYSESQEQAISELATLRQLEHPTIVKGIATGVYGSRTYLVMEYANGIPLDEVPPDSRSTKELDFIVRQLIDAIAYAHTKGIIHRDLKPQNIILSDQNQVKILDFGIASEVVQDLRTRLVEGTYLYMAPEQMAGRINFQNDIWAFGVTLYDWLTGTHPYHSTTIEELSQKMLLVSLDYPHHLNPNISHQLSYILNRCLQKDLSKRYTNFEEIKQDFRHDPTLTFSQILSEEDTISFVKTTIKKARRFNVGLITYACFSIALILFLYWRNPYTVKDFFTYFVDQDEGKGYFHFIFSGSLFVGFLVYYFYMFFTLSGNLGLNNEARITVIQFYADPNLFFKLLEKIGFLTDTTKWNYWWLSRLVDKGKRWKTRRLIKRMLFKNRQDIQVLSYKAFQYFKKNHTDKAIETTQYILRINPDDASGMFFRKVLQTNSSSQMPDDELAATLLRKESSLDRLADSNYSEVLDEISKNGIKSYPIFFVFENFIPIPAFGQLSLFPDYFSIEINQLALTENAFLESGHIQFLRMKYQQGYQISAGKVAFFQNENLIKSLGNLDDAPLPLGVNLFVKAGKVFLKNIGNTQGSVLNEEIKRQFVFPYDQVRRIGLGGRLIEADHVGLIAIDFAEDSHSHDFVEFCQKQSQKIRAIKGNRLGVNLVPIWKYRLRQFGTIILKTLGLIGLWVIALALVLNEKLIRIYNWITNPEEAKLLFDLTFWLIFIPAFGLAIFLFRKQLRQLLQISRNSPRWHYALWRSIVNLVRARKNKDWIHEREKTDFLESVRLIFNASKVEMDEPVRKEKISIDHGSHEFSSFVLNFDERRIEFSSQNIPPIKFGELVMIAIGLHEVLFLANEKGGIIPLEAKEFKQYIPYLLNQFEDKIKILTHFSTFSG